MKLLRRVFQLLLSFIVLAANADELADGFQKPPDSARPWCYWWWLNGSASKEGITRDFDEMRKQGISGALLFDAGEAGPDVPRGPAFMSPQWRELFKHAVREADRCGIVLTVNLCSGWNAGGPWVTPEHAAKKIVSSQTRVAGPGQVSLILPKPQTVDGFYGDIAVMAAPVPAAGLPEPKLTASSSYREHGPALAQDGLDDTRWVSNGFKPGMGPTPQKPEYLQFDYDKTWPAAGLYLKPYPDCGPKDIEVQCSEDGQTYRPLKRATMAARTELTLPFGEVRAKHFRVVFLSSHPFRGEENWNVQVAEIALLGRGELAHGPVRKLWDRHRAVDLTNQLDADGRLTWNAPAGEWTVLRIGCTLHGNFVKCVGSGPKGLEIDTMSAAAMDAHFAETGAKLIADAGPLTGKTLQYFHIDSWELGQPTWTPGMREQFRQRRGYDPWAYLPALLSRTVESAEITERFLADYRRTAADLVAANYYGRLRELTVRGGLRGTHPESGGPFFTHWIDALQCEGINDVPMGEFWKRNVEPDGPITHQGNPSLRQAASAAHIYGKPVCQAEAFTSFACDWIDDPWSMKDIGDAAFCEGLTRHVLCFWIHQPRLDAKPGFQWAHVGTHFDCNLTWWPMSHAWLSYLVRCQHLLRQGRFVADFACLLGEGAPLFGKDRNHWRLPEGFDYDLINAEVLLTRATARNGRLMLPDGMSYRYLVLPPSTMMSLPLLQKLGELVQGGVTVIGPKPQTAPGLMDYPRCDEQVRSLADALWGADTAASARKIVAASTDELLKRDGLAPDVEFRSAPGARWSWIHRRTDDADIYFLSNQKRESAGAQIVFRVAGKQPELWDAVSGETRLLPEFQEEAGRTVVPLRFEPRQSWFVVFRKGISGKRETGSGRNFTELRQIAEIAGPWEVSFDPKWGGPERMTFEKLDDWSKRVEDGIRHYSGQATYCKVFDAPRSTLHASRLFLDLGVVKNLAAVRLNGRDLGVIWTAPWRVEITDTVKTKDNKLEIDVVNLWPNRLIGDAALPKEKRYIITNVKTYESVLPPENEYQTYRCPICAERRKTGKPAALLSSGLLGPVKLLAEDRPQK